MQRLVPLVSEQGCHGTPVLLPRLTMSAYHKRALRGGGENTLFPTTQLQFTLVWSPTEVHTALEGSVRELELFRTLGMTIPTVNGHASPNAAGASSREPPPAAGPPVDYSFRDLKQVAGKCASRRPGRGGGVVPSVCAQHVEVRYLSTGEAEPCATR